MATVLLGWSFISPAAAFVISLCTVILLVVTTKKFSGLSRWVQGLFLLCLSPPFLLVFLSSLKAVLTLPPSGADLDVVIAAISSALFDVVHGLFAGLTSMRDGMNNCTVFLEEGGRGAFLSHYFFHKD